MKKLLIILMACLSLFAVSGCTLFGDGGSTSKSTKCEFAVQYDDELMRYSFEKGETVSISPRYKEGYVLEGFYTKEQGSGTKLIEWNGTCLNNSFAQDGTTILYPKYSEIDYEYTFKSIIWGEENALTASYNVYGDPKFHYSVSSELLGEDYIYKVAISNPQLKFNLTAYADIYDDPGEFSIGVGRECDKGGILNKITFARPSEYTTMSVSAAVKGSVLTSSGNRIFMGFFCTKFGHMIYYKNRQFVISIVHGE